MFRDLVPFGESRLHHRSTYTQNYESDLEHYRKSVAHVVFSALMRGGAVCLLDTVATLGFYTELITANPIKEQIFALFRQAAEAWDGRNPIRRLS